MKLKIFEATPLPAKDPKGIAGKIGEVVAVEGDGVTVVCADGRFKLTRVQADGPKVGAGRMGRLRQDRKGRALFARLTLTLTSPSSRSRHVP